MIDFSDRKHKSFPVSEDRRRGKKWEILVGIQSRASAGRIHNKRSVVVFRESIWNRGIVRGCNFPEILFRGFWGG